MADGRRARTPGRAELATLRLFTVGAAIVTLLIAAVATLVALREADLTLPPWFVALAAVATAAFLATGMLSPWLTYRALRLGAASSANTPGAADTSHPPGSEAR